MHPYINFTVKIMREVAKDLHVISNRLEPWRDNQSMDTIPETISNHIKEQITKAYPEHKINTLEGEYSWVIEAFSGVQNFKKTVPNCTISIAILNKGEVAHTVVYQPMTDELLIASKGVGARLNDKRIKIPEYIKHEPTVNIFLKDISSEKQKQMLETAYETTNHILATGDPITDMSYVASGKSDGFLGANISEAQAMIGSFMIKEAGGFVKKERDILIAGNRSVFNKIAEEA